MPMYRYIFDEIVFILTNQLSGCFFVDELLLRFTIIVIDTVICPEMAG